MTRLRCAVVVAVALMCSGAAAEEPANAQAPIRARGKENPKAVVRQARGRAAEKPAPAPSTRPEESPGEAAAAPAARGAAAPAEAVPEGLETSPRALERLLVQQGGLLLPEWGVEFAPGVAYAHSASDTTLTLAGQTFGQRVRSHLFTASLVARLGLPWELQAETSLTFQSARQNTVLANAVPNNASGTGLGDLRLALTRQVLHRGAVIPDLLATAFWRAPTGSSPWEANPQRVGLGSGAHALGAAISAVKTADPLVFLATASFAHSLPVNASVGRVELGDEWGLSVGALLAVSPETSLSFTVDQKYQPPIQIQRASVPGSERTGAVLQLGVAMLLSARTFLNVTAGFGLTSDVPAFQLAVAAPFQPR